MRLSRIVTIGAVAAVLSFGAAAAPASAAPAPTPPPKVVIAPTPTKADVLVVTTYTDKNGKVLGVTRSDMATPAKVVTIINSWWGKTITVYYNRSETVRIASGTGACATVALVPSVPTRMIGAACAIMSGMANIATASNACVGAAWMYSRGFTYPNLGYRLMYHNNSYCR